MNRCGSQTHPYTENHPYTSGEFINQNKMLSYGLPEIVRAFKSFSARRINQIKNTHGVAVWQRSFYDHIIWNENELCNISLYIQTNPEIWQEDQYHRTI
ncbi:MAG: hypothetical protein A2029_08380 [Chloroflexi bacterium RBG_19FT_COMBO_47_9]|nr:MAG: hypothetical protein A2029_08380 [Chloroflexi bacterium RBG_19FT_COMBO_47_9]